MSAISGGIRTITIAAVRVIPALAATWQLLGGGYACQLALKLPAHVDTRDKTFFQSQLV
jgi:hypothetical protein